MSVEIAKTAGFCFGVKRAVDTVYAEIAKEDARAAEDPARKRCPIYTFGPIIHNEEVVDDLRAKGVEPIGPEDLDRIASKDGYGPGKMIIRSHGVDRMTLEMLRSRGFEIIDATCPFVSKIHDTVRKASENGEYVIVIGDPDHPEVLGITGWVNGPYSVVNDIEDIQKLKLPEGAKVCIVAQTTFNFEKFHFFVEELKKISYYSRAVNTICNATQMRQSEARELAARADVMIVIGGKHSSNTQKLYEICKKECSRTYFVQTVKDLYTEDLPFGGVVGITAGASTPINIIEEVGNLCLS